MEKKQSLFKQVAQSLNSQGELKVQFTVDLTSYDTSAMEGYKENSPIYKGYTVKLATLKPAKAQHPTSRIDFDPSNKDIRKAIMSMYEEFDKLPLLK